MAGQEGRRLSVRRPIEGQEGTRGITNAEDRKQIIIENRRVGHQKKRGKEAHGEQRPKKKVVGLAPEKKKAS